MIITYDIGLVSYAYNYEIEELPLIRQGLTRNIQSDVPKQPSL